MVGRKDEGIGMLLSMELDGGGVLLSMELSTDLATLVCVPCMVLYSGSDFHERFLLLLLSLPLPLPLFGLAGVAAPLGQAMAG